MKKHLLPILALSIVSNSCTISRSFTPVSGPLAQQGVIAIPVKFTWSGSGSGKVEVVMPDGEVCTGRYSTIARGSTSLFQGNSFGSSYTTSGYSPYNSYSTNSSGIYSGISSSHENEQQGEGLVIGNRGTVLKFSYTTSASNPLHGHGSGYDNKGNRYSIVY